MKDLQTQNKQLKDEANRKRDLIQNFKQQKESFEREQKEHAQEL